jgi:hypothetical protein
MPRELSNPLTEDDKAWLRSWNRADEIPDEDGEGIRQELVPGNPPGGETNPARADGGFTPGAGPDPFNGEEPPEDYNDWTGDQLRWELGNRDLPKSGNKPDLVARLEEDDANEDEDEDNG